MSHPAIVVDADLTIRAGTAEGLLSGSGSRLSFETPTLSPFFASAPADLRRGLPTVASRLASMGLSIRVIEDGVEVLEIGDVSRSLIARAFGLRNTRIRRPIRLVASFLRR